jgi:hypothetical protein
MWSVWHLPVFGQSHSFEKVEPVLWKPTWPRAFGQVSEAVPNRGLFYHPQ